MPYGLTPEQKAEEVADVMRLRLAGLSMRGIIADFEARGKYISLGTVQNHIKEGTDDKHAPIPDKVTALAVELLRLDVYLEKLKPMIDKGDLPSIKVALDIQTRRAKLLGLDKTVVPVMPANPANQGGWTPAIAKAS